MHNKIQIKASFIHEVTENGQHLKSSYLTWADKKPKEISSIYHFDRKKTP